MVWRCYIMSGCFVGIASNSPLTHLQIYSLCIHDRLVATTHYNNPPLAGSQKTPKQVNWTLPRKVNLLRFSDFYIVKPESEHSSEKNLGGASMLCKGNYVPAGNRTRDLWIMSPEC